LQSASLLFLSPNPSEYIYFVLNIKIFADFNQREQTYNVITQLLRITEFSFWQQYDLNREQFQESLFLPAKFF